MTDDVTRAAPSMASRLIGRAFLTGDAAASRRCSLRAAGQPIRIAGAVLMPAARPLHGRDLRVVQVEGRRLRADPRDRDEVVPRRRAAGRPLQRAAPAPRVVDLDQRRLARDPDVVEERQRRRAEQERADRRDLVERREAVVGQVVGVSGAACPRRPASAAPGRWCGSRRTAARSAPCRAARRASGRSSSATRSRSRRTSRTPRCRRRRSGSAPPRSRSRRRGSPAAGRPG